MKKLILVLVFALFPLAVSAQTVIVGPGSGVSFTASADHSATITGGTPPVTLQRVVSYQLDVMSMNPSGVLVFTFNLGKPTPDAQNTITVKPIAGFSALAEGFYTATASAVGQGETAVSAPSPFFVRVTKPAAPGTPAPVK